MKKELLTVALLMGTWVASAQVGVGTLNPNKSAQLDVVASDKGILIPRVSLKSKTDATTIANGNVESLLVYNKANAEGVSPGYYYWYDGEWRRMLTPADVSNDVLTVVTYNQTTNVLTYVDEHGVSHDFTLNNTKNSTIVLNGTVLTITDTDGDSYNVDLAGLDTNTTNVSLVLDNQNQLKLTDSANNVLSADLSSLAVDKNTIINNLTLNPVNNHLVLVDSDGNTIDVDLSSLLDDTNTTNTSLVLGDDYVLTLTDSEGNTKTVNLSSLVNTTKVTAGTNVTVTGNGSVATPYNVSVATATANTLGVVMPGEGMTVGADGKLNVTQVITTLTNSRDLGHAIGVYTNEQGVPVTINESITVLTQDASGIHYLSETGETQNAKVVSVNDGNLITTGTDHGALLTKNNVQTAQVKYEVVDGLNTTAVLDATSTTDLQKYKVNVGIANASNLGVVKQATTNPTVFINAAGELSTSASALNNIVEVSANYPITPEDVVVLGNATSDITITLPNALGAKGRKLTIKKSDAANDTYVNVVSAGGTIDGESDLYTSLPYSGWDFMSDGTNWKIVNKF